MRDIAAEQGVPYEPDRADNLHRLNMGMFPDGAAIIPNPYNKIAGLQRRPRALRARLPGDGLADDRVGAGQHRYAHLQGGAQQRERSVIVFGAMEATLTPLMEDVEARFPGIKVFSLPSVDHPQHGRHIELGVKGGDDRLDTAFAALRDGVLALDGRLGPEMVR